jgi:hypothetical protein
LRISLPNTKLEKGSVPSWSWATYRGRIGLMQVPDRLDS